ncbi:MAG: hypothetical protein JWO03_2144 [Bacteroidetes bacterium]|nr:hypothetical protein [Bacteroidota bacterium]
MQKVLTHLPSASSLSEGEGRTCGLKVRVLLGVLRAGQCLKCAGFVLMTTPKPPHRLSRDTVKRALIHCCRETALTPTGQASAFGIFPLPEGAREEPAG